VPLNILSLSEVGPAAGDTGKPPVPRDGWDRPLVVPEEGGSPIALTRMTTHVNVLEDKSNLERYAKRNVLRGASVMDWRELQNVRRLDPNDPRDKRELNRIADRAEHLSGANEKRQHGTHLHDLSEYVDRGEPLPPHASDTDMRDMAAYALATSMLQQVYIETLVVCRDLKASGTPDRVSFYDGLDPDGCLAGNMITDLKTGSVEYGELKMAMQLAGYSRGRFYDHTLFPLPAHDPNDEKARKAAVAAFKKQSFAEEQARAAYTPLPDVNQNWGLIINLPAGTGTCTVYWIDLRVGWAAANLATQVREARKHKVLVPFGVSV
jgi:hypothetical protein